MNTVKPLQKHFSFKQTQHIFVTASLKYKQQPDDSKIIHINLWNNDVRKFLPVSFMREILSSLRSSYTRVPATSLSSFRRWESGAVAIWLICTNIVWWNTVKFWFYKWTLIFKSDYVTLVKWLALFLLHCLITEVHYITSEVRLHRFLTFPCLTM